MLWRSFKRLLSYEITLILLFVVCYIICRTFNITCLIFNITKVPCPTCNMGRALISLLKGDFEQYITHNIMAVPVSLVFMCEVFSMRFGKYKSVIHICSVFILTINMLYYLVRINLIF